MEPIQVKCDRYNCGYVTATSGGEISTFVNKPCPKCGASLLTQKDYRAYLLLQRIRANAFVRIIEKIATVVFRAKPKKTQITSDTLGNLRFTPVKPTHLDTIKFDPSTTLADVERKYVESALDYYDGNKTKASQALDISIKSLYDRTTGYANSDKNKGEVN